MKLAIITAHAGAESIADAVCSWATIRGYPFNNPIFSKDGGLQNAVLHTDPTVFIEDGRCGMLGAFEVGLLRAKDYDILAFLHDDTIINDKDWVYKVLKEFEDPQVGLVGFGGALGHGTRSLYKEPYQYEQLARQDFLSNMEDAENHGRRYDGSCDVAVLDGFALIVRREVLEKMGGWPLNTPIGYIAYDYWLCCMTRRLGYRIRLVGVPCKHLGGQTFVKLKIGQGPQHWEQYLAAHKYIYDEFKDVLPYRVTR